MSMKPRISIAMLLAAMVPVAVGFAALANPTAFWEGAIFLFTMVVMFAAVLGVCYRREAERAFWVGFSLFGWGLFLVSSDLKHSIRPGADMWSSFGTASEHDQMRFTAFVRNVVDMLQLNRNTVPKSIGEKVQVQWGRVGITIRPPCPISKMANTKSDTIATRRAAGTNGSA
jgi:hypothetical protein